VLKLPPQRGSSKKKLHSQARISRKSPGPKRDDEKRRSLSWNIVAAEKTPFLGKDVSPRERIFSSDPEQNKTVERRRSKAWKKFLRTRKNGYFGGNGPGRPVKWFNAPEFGAEGATSRCTKGKKAMWPKGVLERWSRDLFAGRGVSGQGKRSLSQR